VKTELRVGETASCGPRSFFYFLPVDHQAPSSRLATHLGLAIGISSGANFLGALQLQEDLGPDATVATIFCDSNKKYLSTDLLRDEPVRPGYLSPEIELLGVETAAATT
jgi:hypothetical protein